MDDQRELHFINPDDVELFDRIKSWVQDNQEHHNVTLEETTKQFGKEFKKNFPL